MSDKTPTISSNYSTDDTKSQEAEEKTSEEKTLQPWIYSEIVKQHFLDPHHFLMGDETKYPHDGEGIVGNPVCGDQMLMLIQVDPKTRTIKDLKWKTYGCASAIASTSALADLAIGKTLERAKNITAEEIAESLGGLPKHKFHCSVLGHEALAKAIEDYETKKTASATGTSLGTSS